MKVFRLLIALLVLGLAPLGRIPVLLAQQTESRITGRVLDQSQAALPGVTVTVTHKASGALRTEVTVGLGTARQTQVSFATTSKTTRV